MVRRFLPVLSLLLFVPALPGGAAALEGCTLGQQVIIPGGKVGTVTEVLGSACRVRANEAIHGEAVWAAFMLRGADGTDPSARPPETSVAAATYECYSTAGYSFVDVVITGPGTYEDRDGNAGTYSVAPDGRITYHSGTFADHESYVRNGKIYLTAPGGDFYMTCDP